MPKDKEKTIIITSVAGDSEALQLAIDLKKYLESQNWKVSEIGQFTRVPPIKGIQVNPISDGSVEFWIGSMLRQ